MTLVPLDLHVPADEAERVALEARRRRVERDRGLHDVPLAHVSSRATEAHLDDTLADVVRRPERAAQRAVFEDVHARGVDLALRLEVEGVDVPVRQSLVSVGLTEEQASAARRTRRPS